ncbi:hypothetical protein OAU13_00610 [bacterium]|nr:hypothetical protein [bacterium]
MDKKPSTSEERAAQQAEAEKKIADWKTSNPERAAECERLARENTDKFLEERKVLRETDHDAYMKLINNEPSASRDPELYFAKQLRNLVATEMRNDAIAKRKADFEKAQAEKRAARAVKSSG